MKAIQRLSTEPDKIAETLLQSIRFERMVKRDHRDIARGKSTQKKLSDIINKHSPK